MAISISNTATRNATGATRVTGQRATSRKANIGLWTAQGGLALLFLFAGIGKFTMPAAELTADTAFSAEFLRFIGVCETLGAVGLVLPWLLNIRRELTSLAATGLTIIMIGATVSCAIEIGAAAAIPPFVTGLVAVAVAVGRRQA